MDQVVIGPTQTGTTIAPIVAMRSLAGSVYRYRERSISPLGDLGHYMDSSQRSGTHDSNFHLERSSSQAQASRASLREVMEVHMDHHRVPYIVRHPRRSPPALLASQEPQKLSSAWDAWPSPPPAEIQHSHVLEEHLMDLEDFNKHSPSFKPSYDHTIPILLDKEVLDQTTRDKDCYSWREISPEFLLLQQQLRFANLGILMKVMFRMTPQRVVGSSVFDTFSLRFLLHFVLWCY